MLFVGTKCIIESDFGENFEVVVLEGNQLVHYWHDNADLGSPWRRAQVISTQATSPGSIIQSTFRTGEYGNFEVVVPEGDQVIHYWHDNSDVNSPWHRGLIIAPPVHIRLRAVQNNQGRFIEVDGDSFTPNGVVALIYDIFTWDAPETHQTGEQNAVADGTGGLNALIMVNVADISGANVKAVDTASNRSAIARSSILTRVCLYSSF
jgi:hypothetical protein